MFQKLLLPVFTSVGIYTHLTSQRQLGETSKEVLQILGGNPSVPMIQKEMFLT